MRLFPGKREPIPAPTRLNERVGHVGLLAHSTEGAALCFAAYCQEGARRLGAHTYPDVTLDYIAFGHSMAAWDAGDLDAVRAVLARSVERLAAAGATFFACPDNTAHLALEHPGPALALPGLHIAEVVADAARRAGHRCVGVLGTRFTMDGPIYPRVLAGRGIAAMVPEATDRTTVDRIVFDELVDGVVTDASRAAYVQVVARLAERGCDAVALVCTEIPILLTPEHSPLPVLDSTRLIAGAALDVGLGDRPAPTWHGGPTDS